MMGEIHKFTTRYRRKTARSAPVRHSYAYNAAVMRALIRFPEARQAVIAELDRAGLD